MQNRKTKIVATLGPPSLPKIKDLILAGVNCFRLNFSHIRDPTTQITIIEEIRAVSEKLGVSVACSSKIDYPLILLGDLGGPKIRCNDFLPLQSIPLIKGSNVILRAAPETNRDLSGKDGLIITPIPEIIRKLEVGHRVLLDDGSLVLKVTQKTPGGEIVDGVQVEQVICTVLVGGILKPKKGINTPDIKLDIPALTEKDKIDAAFMYKYRLPYVALSFVQKAQDVQDLLDFFKQLEKYEVSNPPWKDSKDLYLTDLEENWRPQIVSKIETPHAIAAIDEIIGVTDAIMVARGDLGVEVSLSKVPRLQKMMISKANAAEKPVITATQMLETMITNPSPTRAEVSDVANAVFDGTDAVMLSAESAVGQYPIEAVTMMAEICQEAELDARFVYRITPEEHVQMKSFRKPAPSKFAHSIADAAVSAGGEAKANTIIVFTTSADMAIMISKRRPHRSIISVTCTKTVYTRLALLYGVFPIYSLGLKPDPHTDVNINVEHLNTDWILAKTESDLALLSKKLEEVDVENAMRLRLPKVGDVVVFTAGKQVRYLGLSNSLKISEFGDAMRSKRAQTNWKASLATLKKKSDK